MQNKIVVFIFILLLFHLSTVYAAQVLFTPALEISQQFTDNVYLDHHDGEDDYITSAGLNLTWQMLWRTAGLTLHYYPTYNSYMDNDQLNNWHHLGELNLLKSLSRNTRIALNDTYLLTNDPTDNAAPGDDLLIDQNRRGRNEYNTNTAEVNLLHNFGSNDSISIACEYYTFKEIDPPQAAFPNDNNTITPSVTLVYNMTPRWGFYLNAAYAISDYADQNDRNEFDGSVSLQHRFTRTFNAYLNYRYTALNYDQETDEDYTVHEPSIGVRYDFQENAYIEIGAGYYIQQFDTSDNTEGFIITSDISKRWEFSRAFIGFSGRSGYQIDDAESADYGFNIYYIGRIDAGYNFTNLLSGSVYASYCYNDYPDDPADRFGETTLTGAALSWQTLRWFNLRFAYGYRTFNSNDITSEYTENRIQLTVGLAPSTPYRWN